MRTTLTIDDDVAAWIRKLAAKRKAKPKDIINEALRQGLYAMEQPKKKKGDYKLPTFDVGQCLVGDLMNCTGAALEYLDEIEGPGK